MAQEITTNALVNGSSICPGTRVSFTCETRGSFAIAWSSDEFIGTGNVQLLFAAGANVVGDNRRRNNAFDAEAVLDRNDDENGVQVLVSTLYITVLPNLPDGSVTCMHVGNGNTSSINIGVMGKKSNNKFHNKNDYYSNCHSS